MVSFRRRRSPVSVVRPTGRRTLGPRAVRAITLHSANGGWTARGICLRSGWGSRDRWTLQEVGNTGKRRLYRIALLLDVSVQPQDFDGICIQVLAWAA